MDEAREIVPYFTGAELKCKCGHPNCTKFPPMGPEQMMFLKKISMIREIRGYRILVVSWFRCPYNPETNNNPTSAHCQGLAMDLAEMNGDGSLVDPRATYTFLEGFFWNGMGINEKGRTVHVDQGMGRVARWKYNHKKVAGNVVYVPEYLYKYTTS